VSLPVPVCNDVSIATPKRIGVVGRKGLRVLYGRTVSVGAEIPELLGRVVKCRPNPCIVDVTTSVKIVDDVRFKTEELRFNYIVRVIRNEVEDVYVYPKRIWDIVVHSVVEPLVSGKPLHGRQGVVLYGPPGTGKTSLANMIAEMSGLNVVPIKLGYMISKWVGETEKELIKRLIEAERSEPSIALADDADWLLASRGSMGPEMGGYGAMISNLVLILLDTIESWYRYRRQILFVATTNRPPEFLDKALIRSGRLGRPVYVPLPDFEAVYEFFRVHGVDDKTAEKWAVKVVNLGLSMADAKHVVLPALLEGKKPEIEPVREEGYRRYAPEFKLENLVSKVFEALERNTDVCRSLSHRIERDVQTLIHFVAPFPVALAFANTFLMYQCRIPTVTLVDPRRTDTAAEAAASLRGVLIAPSTLHRELISVARSFTTAIAFVGEEAPDLPFGERPLRIELERLPGLVKGDRKATESGVAAAVAAVVLGFYGVEYDEQRLLGLSAPDFKRFLESLALAGSHGADVGDLFAFR